MLIKICGITTVSDALLAVALGTDALGFIFAPSPRQVTPKTVGSILSQLPSEVLTFGVFNNERPEHVVETVHTLGLSGAQVHGDLGHEGIDYVTSRVRKTIRAYPAGHERLGELKRVRPWAILLDSPSPGSGKVFDWSLVDAVPERSRLILAGGLNPENVSGAIAAVKPFGVDVASGVEATPGHKDPVKLRAFIAAARKAQSQELTPSSMTFDDHEQDGPFNWEMNA